jgi:hypothetical protein
MHWGGIHVLVAFFTPYCVVVLILGLMTVLITGAIICGAIPAGVLQSWNAVEVVYVAILALDIAVMTSYRGIYAV